MKKSNKTKLIAMSFAVGALLTGCEPKKEQPAEVYGPPIVNSTETNTEKKQEITTEASTDIDPTTEYMRTLYGPREDFDDN